MTEQILACDRSQLRIARLFYGISVKRCLTQRGDSRSYIDIKAYRGPVTLERCLIECARRHTHFLNYLVRVLLEFRDWHDGA